MATSEETPIPKDTRVLVKHNNVLYDAKILSSCIDETSKVLQYYVHYMGWSSKWDEWVPTDRVRMKDDTKEGLENENIVTYSKRSTEQDSNNKQQFSNQKLSTMFPIQSEPQIPVILPELLRRILVNDWICIECQSKWVSFPRSPSVQTILNDVFFKSSLTDFSGATKEQIDIVCNSLCEYFDKFFMSTLLYHCERNYIKTYASELENGEYSKYFGAEHFLRLLYQYPSLVYHTDLCERDVSIICLILCELYRYLENHKDIFLQSTSYISNPLCL